MKSTDLILLALAGVAVFLVVKGVAAKPAQAAPATLIPAGGLNFAPEMKPQLFTGIWAGLDPSQYGWSEPDSFFKP